MFSSTCFACDASSSPLSRSVSALCSRSGARARATTSAASPLDPGVERRRPRIRRAHLAGLAHTGRNRDHGRPELRTGHEEIGRALSARGRATAGERNGRHGHRHRTPGRGAATTQRHGAKCVRPIRSGLPVPARAPPRRPWWGCQRVADMADTGRNRRRGRRKLSPGVHRTRVGFDRVPKALRASCRSALLSVLLTLASREVWSVCHGCAVRRPGVIRSAMYPSDRRGSRCASPSGSRDLCALAAAAGGSPRPDRALRRAVGVLGSAGRGWRDAAAVLGGGVVRSIDAGCWPAPLAYTTRGVLPVLHHLRRPRRSVSLTPARFDPSSVGMLKTGRHDVIRLIGRRMLRSRRRVG